MTGATSYHAHSAQTPATEPMGFPYQNTRAWLGYGCSGFSEWAYIGFSESPNLGGTTIADGHERIRTRIRWDEDAPETVDLRQDWGASFIRFAYGVQTVERMTSAGSVLLELNWYGSGGTYFRFSLSGSSAAIARARAECGIMETGPAFPADIEYVGNAQTKRYGPTSRECWRLVVGDPDRAVRFKSREEAREAGYRPSAVCR